MRHPLGFPPRSLSFWTSILTVTGLFIPNKKVRAIAGFAGMLCGLGGAGMVYERTAQRANIPREPVQIIRHANAAELKNMAAHLIFGIIGATELLKES